MTRSSRPRTPRLVLDCLRPAGGVSGPPYGLPIPDSPGCRQRHEGGKEQEAPQRKRVRVRSLAAHPLLPDDVPQCRRQFPAFGERVVGAAGLVGDEAQGFRVEGRGDGLLPVVEQVADRRLVVRDVGRDGRADADREDGDLICRARVDRLAQVVIDRLVAVADEDDRGDRVPTRAVAVAVGRRACA